MAMEMEAQDLAQNQEEDDKEEKTELAGSKMMTQPSLEEVENIIGYKFNNKALLREALTDKTYRDDGLNYERLEYLGDSVLTMLMAKEQYLNYPDLTPGEWTSLRAANVDTEKLARVALKLNLHNYLRHNKCMLDEQIRKFKEEIVLHPIHSFGLIDAPKVLADIVESTIGAVLVDTKFSFDITSKVVKEILHPMVTPETFRKNPVTRLLEACQRRGSKVQRDLDKWEKTGEVEYIIDGKVEGKGIYKTKKLIAVNIAAAKAYDNYMLRNTTKELLEALENDIDSLSTIC